MRETKGVSWRVEIRPDRWHAPYLFTKLKIGESIWSNDRLVPDEISMRGKKEMLAWCEIEAHSIGYGSRRENMSITSSEL